MPWRDVGPAQERSAQRHRHERRGGLQRQSQWWPTAEPRTGHGVRTRRLSETGGGRSGAASHRPRTIVFLAHVPPGHATARDPPIHPIAHRKQAAKPPWGLEISSLRN